MGRGRLRKECNNSILNPELELLMPPCIWTTRLPKNLLVQPKTGCKTTTFLVQNTIAYIMQADINCSLDI